ncbi:hypothetical protein [Arthrobacter sp. CJ23]|nr:hypothetical protein [Arthrobacter sp. CJ23]UVJ39288.1 hypothetical protein NVV90_19130 [Arthrobacter sp. CJ23]
MGTDANQASAVPDDGSEEGAAVVDVSRGTLSLQFAVWEQRL